MICVDEKVEKLAAVVHGIVAGIPVPFPLPNPNACKDSGLQCPLVSGKAVNYVATLPILHEYPAVSADRCTLVVEVKICEFVCVYIYTCVYVIICIRVFFIACVS